MKLAYVAGPYRGKSKNRIINRLQVISNIIEARKVARELWKMGYAAICPHSNSALFDGIVRDDVFLWGDLEILKRCDIIVMVPNWLSSSGAVDEFCLAEDKGILIHFIRDGKLELMTPNLYKKVTAMVGQQWD
jgi:hypothetical protein